MIFSNIAIFLWRDMWWDIFKYRPALECRSFTCAEKSYSPSAQNCPTLSDSASTYIVGFEMNEAYIIIETFQFSEDFWT